MGVREKGGAGKYKIVPKGKGAVSEERGANEIEDRLKDNGEIIVSSEEEGRIEKNGEIEEENGKEQEENDFGF